MTASVSIPGVEPVSIAFPHPGPATRPGTDRAILAGRMVIGLVSFATGVSESAIMAPNRGPGETARARQIAMYLLHTCLSAPYGEVARAFRRDRTTVSHACRLIEDMRDDPRHDRLLSRLEAVLTPAAPVFSLGQEG